MCIIFLSKLSSPRRGSLRIKFTFQEKRSVKYACPSSSSTVAEIENVMDYEDVQRFLVRYLAVNSSASGHDGYVNFYVGAYYYIRTPKAYEWQGSDVLFQDDACQPPYSFICDAKTFDPHPQRKCVILSLKRDEGETWKWKLSAASCHNEWLVLCQEKSIESEPVEAATATLMDTLMDKKEAEKWIMS